MLPGPLESPLNGFSVESNNIPPSNSTLTEAENTLKNEKNQAQNEPSPEAISETSEPATPQMGRNEPFENTQDKPLSGSSKNPVREILAKAQFAIQNKKRKKLDSILTLFAKRTNITNDEVEKFLHVSDATATRYLSILEKENKIKQVGKTGKGVSYSRI